MQWDLADLGFMLKVLLVQHYHSAGGLLLLDDRVCHGILATAAKQTYKR